MFEKKKYIQIHLPNSAKCFFFFFVVQNIRYFVPELIEDHYRHLDMVLKEAKNPNAAVTTCGRYESNKNLSFINFKGECNRNSFGIIKVCETCSYVVVPPRYCCYAFFFVFKLISSEHRKKGPQLQYTCIIYNKFINLYYC